PVAALKAGYRPCQRCMPLQAERTPDWIRPLLEKIDAAPDNRWTDATLARAGMDPIRVRRWFKHEFGTTFHEYVRARRIGLALERLARSEEHTSELQSRENLVCRLLLEKKKKKNEAYENL